MQRETLRVKCRAGLHARPAAEFAQLCKRISSDVKLEKDGKTVQGKSIIGIMSLGVSSGDGITVIVDGEDEAAAMEQIKELLNKE